MTQQNERLAQVVEQIRQAPGLLEQLPEQEASLARQALQGLSVYELAQQQRISEGAVWSHLESIARLASGQTTRQVEVGGGLGSDFGPADE